jgi:ABC-2 type transport system ATP-binding protein
VRQLCDRVIMLDHGHVMVDGSPIEGIRALRDQFSSEEEEAAVVEERSGRLKITNPRITDGSGELKARFKPGESLGIEFDVVATEPTDDWAAGILITNAVDLGVYGTNSVLQSVTLPPIKDHCTVRYRFDEIPLVEGQYHVTVAVHPVVGPEYHRLDRVVAFKVFSDLNDDGVVYMRPKLEVVNA